MEKVIWKPQKKQSLFMERPEYECLYGGAAGGGKSDALLIEALRQVSIPHYRGLILRKTYPQLSELIDRSRILYTAAFPAARYLISERCWNFPSGAKIYFGAMQHTKDRLNYQGKRYDFIGFDELTHFTFEEYSYMFSRSRPSGKGTRVYIRATTNPGGIGHSWVKERFITAAPPMTPIKEYFSTSAPDGSVITQTRERIFIPASVFDNEALLSEDPNYLANLSMLPEAERAALLYGNWDSFDGQVFPEWKNDQRHYKDRLFTHVIEPFRIPYEWPIYRGFDFGFSKPFSVGWFAIDFEGRIYHIRELYGCTGVADEGLKIEPHEIARRIREIENDDPNLKGRKIIGVADPSIYDESRGESVARMMEASPNFIYFTPGDNSRTPGKMQFHYRFSFDEDGRPLFYCFNTCKNFIRTIPSLVYSTSNVEDVDTAGEDHIYDMTRYVFMTHKVLPRKPSVAPSWKDDPLDLACSSR
jgi:hypothetical protein